MIPERLFRGWATIVSSSTGGFTFPITYQYRVWSLFCSSAPGGGTDLFLPLPQERYIGGPVFYFTNITGFATGQNRFINIKLNDGTDTGINLDATGGGNQSAIVCLENATGQGTWRIMTTQNNSI